MLAECHLLVVKNEKAKIKAMVATPRKKKKKKSFHQTDILRNQTFLLQSAILKRKQDCLV